MTCLFGFAAGFINNSNYSSLFTDNGVTVALTLPYEGRDCSEMRSQGLFRGACLVSFHIANMLVIYTNICRCHCRRTDIGKGFLDTWWKGGKMWSEDWGGAEDGSSVVVKFHVKVVHIVR